MLLARRYFSRQCIGYFWCSLCFSPPDKYSYESRFLNEVRQKSQFKTDYWLQNAPKDPASIVFLSVLLFFLFFLRISGKIALSTILLRDLKVRPYSFLHHFSSISCSPLGIIHPVFATPQGQERFREARSTPGYAHRTLLHFWEYETLPIVAWSLGHPSVSTRAPGVSLTARERACRCMLQ